MHTALVLLIIFLVIFFGIKFIRIGSASIPDVDEDTTIKFSKTLPPDFVYAYYLDGTGYAINVEAGKIYLHDTNTTSSSNYSKIYERSQIREISWRIDGWEYMHDYRPLAALDNVVNKREARKQAYKDSGIFIKVVDIDHPTWQIRFSSKPLLERNYEILHQFMDGDLQPPQSEPAKS